VSRFQIRVVAAVIERDGQILICQRRRGANHSLKWEFPGGKIEPGEGPAAALQRELEEELAIQAHVGPEIIRYEYCYPNRNPLLLIFFRVSDFLGEPCNLEFEEIRWEAREFLPTFDFVEGDIEFVGRLSRGEL
jgi:8-oxo-dGTP diphosphatase